MSENVLIIGATSAIARAVAHEMARRSCNVIVAGRDQLELERTAADLALRYRVKAVAKSFDALDFASHASFFQSCIDQFDGGLAGIILCHGYMPDQAAAEHDFDLARQTIDTNFTSGVSILSLAANYLQPRGHGYICAVSSVAGDRGRQSNYIYGSSKAGLATYLEGLRNRLFRARIPVINIKPGFVDTGMTWGLPGLFLVATPEKVATDICRAIAKGRDTVYTPWFWWGIMTIIRSIPSVIFKRMKL